ncbi:class I SAM-dependent methyltransferase [Yaniella flava]|uniref:Class I SAM-dependent methyltransferase n=1 Tax=Yaniella flava TaxID=287930 RepID=A0ABP5GC40_9MICC|nr:methyltransferase domain-containing protein [Micrococcaceae bacterium]
MPALPRLHTRDREATERMDDPDCDLSKLHRTYAQFHVINRVVAGWQQTYRRYLRPVLAHDRTNTLLDIGAGGADVTRAIARWAHRDGFRIHITAADPDERASAWAMRDNPGDLVYEQALSSDLVDAGRNFDLVISNHLLHHLQDDELQSLLHDSKQLARIRAVHSDIRRSQAAYMLFSAGTWPFFPGSFIREDGLVSIRRSYTAEEMAAAAPSGWRVEFQRPWRNLLIYDAEGATNPEPDQP